MKARNATRGVLIGRAVARAETFAARARGLLGRSSLRDGEGLWIAPCRCIHSFGMRFPFDALFLDGSLRVVAAYRSFRPNRMSRVHLKAQGVLELPAGTIDATGSAVGDQVEFFD